jgi:hypothetical protein
MTNSSTQQPLSRTTVDRRESPDRRTSGDRRRSAERRTMILQITPDVLRALIMVERSGGQPILGICRSMPWRIDAESLHTSQGAHELTAAISKLAGEERLAGGGVEILLGSDLCVTRAVTGVADEVQRDTAALRERSQLYLSLGPGKKVIASSSTPLDARHAHALLTVATEKTLQVLLQAIESAGMELAAIRSAQVCLARAVQFADDAAQGASLVIGVDSDRVELGVISGGRLFLDYRPGGDTRVGQLADLLGQHHARLQRYCQRHHGLKGDKLTHVVVSGASDEAQRAAASLASLRHLEVQLLDLASTSLPWEHRGDELSPDMAAAVGAALAMADPHSDRGPNLVDQMVSTGRSPTSKLLVRKLAPLAATLIVAAVLGALNWNLRREVAAMQTELAVLAPKAARASTLRFELLAGLSEMQQLAALAERLPEPPHALLIQNLTQSIPPNVWLSGVRISGDNTATLGGASYTESSIYDLVNHLQHLPGVSQVALQGTGAGRSAHRSATTFDILLDLELTGTATNEKESL